MKIKIAHGGSYAIVARIERAREVATQKPSGLDSPNMSGCEFRSSPSSDMVFSWHLLLHLSAYIQVLDQIVLRS